MRFNEERKHLVFEREGHDESIIVEPVMDGTFDRHTDIVMQPNGISGEVVRGLDGNDIKQWRGNNKGKYSFVYRLCDTGSMRFRVTGNVYSLRVERLEEGV